MISEKNHKNVMDDCQEGSSGRKRRYYRYLDPEEIRTRLLEQDVDVSTDSGGDISFDDSDLDPTYTEKITSTE